jgi:hypothetical protein
MRWWYKFQLRLMGKPSGKATTAAGIFVSWMCVGGMLAVALLFTSAVVRDFDRFLHPVAPVVLLALLYGMVFLVAWAAYSFSAGKGYVDAIHRQYLKDREIRRRRLLGKLNARSGR